MKNFPPHILVKTWLQVLKSKEIGLEQQKIKLNKIIEELFGSIELAELYVEQIAENEVEVSFV